MASEIVWEPRALPLDGVPDRPLADLAFYWVLSSHPALAHLGLTVELVNDPSARKAPWVRHGVVRYATPTYRGESTPIAGVDVFAASGLEAADIANKIAQVWPRIKKTSISGDDAAFISGAWVEIEPYRMDEPDDGSKSERLARFHLELGLRLHPKT